MIFFISRAQDIDNVILMQSMGNVSFDKLRKLTVCMCENRFQQNHLMKNWIQKNQTNMAENWFQTCSDIFCGKYISRKGSHKINPIRREGFQKIQCVKHGFQQSSLISQKSRSKQS